MVAVAALLVSACGADRDDGGEGAEGSAASAAVGITDTTITIGGSYPFTGPASAYGVDGASSRAYFDWVNENGGVKMADGKTRTIEFKAYDDEYAPDKTVENVRRLVEQDEVFAIFGIGGTPTNLAVREYLNDRGIPQVLLATGASTFGDYEQYPWTMGWQPPYPGESTVYVEYLKKTNPDAKVAILHQNDQYGEEYVGSFEQAAKGSDITIVAKESYEATDPSIDSQIVNLARSGADTFFNASITKPAAQAIKRKAELGWEAEQLLNNLSSSIEGVLKPAGLENAKDIVTVAFMKDAADKEWADEPDMVEYKRLAEESGEFDVNDPRALLGWSESATLVHALERMESPTRQGLIDSLRSMSDFAAPLLLPGITVTTAPDDGFPIESMQLKRFNGKNWELFGDVVSFEGKTRPFGG